jgi:ribose transport system substrate-binding protein
MRKLFVVISLMLVAAMLIGCEAKVTPPVVIETPEEVNPLEGKTFYWLAANIGNAFYVPGLEGWNAAAKELGVKVQFVGPLEGLGLADQINTFEQLNADPNTGGILFYAMDFNASEPLIQDAEGKGIPVVVANTDSPFKTRSGFIGTDHKQMGQAAAGYAAKILDCKGSVGGIGNNSVVVPLRIQAFNEQIKVLCPDITVYEASLYDGSALAAVATVDAYMVAHPDLSLLWFADGAANNTIGPWKERVQAGCTTLFLGSDMPPAALEAVKDGTWIGSMGQDTWAEEYWGLTMLVNKALGKSIPDTIYVASLVVTKDNVDQWIGK